jgi:hypothetical protein
MKYFAEQGDVCKFLVHEMRASEIGFPDKHGNTMLHYLASTRAPNESLIDWLKLQETGALMWQEAVNIWGHTPQDLYEDGQHARTLAKGASEISAYSRT